MAKKMTISTNKGGVLKTSIATNLAGVLSKKGKVLIIDTDNQGNATISFGINPDEIETTLYDVMVHGEDVRKAVTNVYENIDILPSNDEMAFLEFDVLTNLTKYNKPFELMKNHVTGIEDDYDYIIIDTPPNMGLMHGNALVYSDEILIPFQPETYSMRSLTKTLKSINQFKDTHNKDLSILGVIATLVDSRTTLHTEVLQECRKFCHEKNIKLFDTIIPRTIRYASSIAYEGKPATLTTKNNALIHAYHELEGEIFNG